VLAHAKHLDAEIRRLSNGRQAFEGSYYDPHNGNFTVGIIDHYMARNNTGLYLRQLSLPPYAPVSPPGTLPPHTQARIVALIEHIHRCEETYSNGILPGSTKAQVLSRLPQGATSAILHNIKFVGQRLYGHATCIRQWEGNWWYIDSEDATPKLLTDGDDSALSHPRTLNWGLLYGKVSVLETGTKDDRLLHEDLRIADGTRPFITPHVDLRPSPPRRAVAHPPPTATATAPDQPGRAPIQDPPDMHHQNHQHQAMPAAGQTLNAGTAAPSAASRTQ
jgi:hypothetical protein